MRDAFGWSLALVAGATWGVTFFSWGLPLPISTRIVATILLVVALATSRRGLMAGAAFTLGMGGGSSLLVASSGLFLGPWGLVPTVALASGLLLFVLGMRPAAE